jgi:hypothetical protein
MRKSSVDYVLSQNGCRRLALRRQVGLAGISKSFQGQRFEKTYQLLLLSIFFCYGYYKMDFGWAVGGIENNSGAVAAFYSNGTQETALLGWLQQQN